MFSHNFRGLKRHQVLPGFVEELLVDASNRICNRERRCDGTMIRSVVLVACGTFLDLA